MYTFVIAIVIEQCVIQHKRELFHNLRQLYDPKQYKLYSEINAASEHSMEMFDSVIKTFKEKKLLNWRII